MGSKKLLTEEEKRLKRKEYEREYRKKNKEKIREQGREYRKKNKEKTALRLKKYYKKNKEKIAKYNKEYNKKNKEKIKEKRKDYLKKYREDNKEQRREYYKKNKEKILKKHRKYNKENKEKISEQQKKYNGKNKENVKFWRKRYEEENADKIRARKKIYYEENKEQINEQHKKYNQIIESIEKRRKRDFIRGQDIAYRLNGSMSSGMRHSLKKNNISKGNRCWEKLAGYTGVELKSHLESLFNSGMGWDNYGEWQIDHIIPLSFFVYTDVENSEFKYAWSLDNLQPLWAKDNIRKSDNINWRNK
jgi:hypothetical protein